MWCTQMAIIYSISRLWTVSISEFVDNINNDTVSFNIYMVCKKKEWIWEEKKKWKAPHGPYWYDTIWFSYFWLDYCVHRAKKVLTYALIATLKWNLTNK